MIIRWNGSQFILTNNTFTLSFGTIASLYPSYLSLLMGAWDSKLSKAFVTYFQTDNIIVAIRYESKKNPLFLLSTA